MKEELTTPDLFPEPIEDQTKLTLVHSEALQPEPETVCVETSSPLKWLGEVALGVGIATVITNETVSDATTYTLSAIAGVCVLGAAVGYATDWRARRRNS